MHPSNNHFLTTSGNNPQSGVGKQKHGAYNPGPTYVTARHLTKLPSGKYPDAIDFTNKIVRELKPNNPSQQRRGLAQVKAYARELEIMFGDPPGSWKYHVDLY